jgi:hypothetical protein
LKTDRRGLAKSDGSPQAFPTLASECKVRPPVWAATLEQQALPHHSRDAPAQVALTKPAKARYKLSTQAEPVIREINDGLEDLLLWR